MEAGSSTRAAGLPPEGLDAVLAALCAWLQATLDAPVEALAAAGTLTDALERFRDSRLETVSELALAHASVVESLARRTMRFAFDLHDGPIQELAAAGLTLQLARAGVAKLPDSNLGDALDDIYARLDSLEQDLRELAQPVARPALADLPLEAVVRDLVEAFARSSGVEAVAHVAGTFERTTPSQRIALARILQSGLANVGRHAEATRVEVTLRCSEETVELTIEDDGRGFDVATTLDDAARRGRLGLVGMRERARLLGGKCALESRPGGPTRVVVALDLRRG